MSIAGPAYGFPHLREQNSKFPSNQKRFSISSSHLSSCFALDSLLHLHSAVKFEEPALNVWPHLLGALLIVYRNKLIGI